MLKEDTPIEPLEIAKTIARAAAKKKGEEITILDVRNVASFCDFFVLANGTNRRQVRAIADAIHDDVKALHGANPIGIEGLEACRWVLLDFGEVVVHVFDEPLRGFYDLDGLWADGKKIEIDLDAPVGESAPRQALGA